MAQTTDAQGRRKRTTPQSTGKRITLQERDLLWLRELHEHGPLASSFLLEFAIDLGTSKKRAKERLTDLFNEDNTVHGGAYLTRPAQQFRTIDSRYNQLVYDLTPAGEKALKEKDLWREHSASSAGPWLHGFMVSSITASIKLAVLDRDDLNYISQHKILGRAKTELRYPTTIIDPQTGGETTKMLIPDALFGLEYLTEKGSRFRFFVVEADRATEPATTKNFNRKSFLRNQWQYRDYVAGGLYKEHLKLTAPLLALNVCSDSLRLEQMLVLTKKFSEGGNAYMLFAAWESFGDVFKPPLPNGDLLKSQWRRAGLAPLRIDIA